MFLYFLFSFCLLAKSVHFREPWDEDGYPFPHVLSFSKPTRMKEELEHEPTQGDDLSDIDVNFLAKTIRTQSERVIGLSMRALQSYSI